MGKRERGGVLVCVCPTFVHQLVKQGDVGEEEQVCKHLSLDLRVNLVALQKLLCTLQHLWIKTHCSNMSQFWHFCLFSAHSNICSGTTRHHLRKIRVNS